MKNSIEYNGNVRITINKRSFKYTNAGTLQLFKVIANILSGNAYYSSDALPGYISCVERNKTNPSEDRDIVSPVMISNRTVEEDAANNKVTLRLAAMFTYTDKKYNPGDDNYAIYLELHDNTSTKNTLAEVWIKDKELISQIEKGRSALIEWDLVFSNGGNN